MSESDNDRVNYEQQVLGEGVPFERLRRITGYLVGTVDRWNDGKKAELNDRVKHEQSEQLSSSNKK